MSGVRRASLDDPTNVRPIPRGTGAMARVGPLAIGRARLEPGWRWSDDLKPIVGTEWCENHHLHVLLSGRFAVRLAGQDDHEEFAPGDVFDLPAGHDAWVVGDDPVELLDVSGNVAEFGRPAASSRVLATLLMSDIVDSTPTVERVGDATWRQMLADHDRVVRSAIARFRGREIDTTGDGFFAAFDSPVAALACARAMREAVAHLGLAIRIGVHTGEIETTHDGVRGIAVHTVARVMAAAGPSEIVASSVTQLLTTGSGLVFESRGERPLKGLAQAVELFELR